MLARQKDPVEINGREKQHKETIKDHALISSCIVGICTHVCVFHLPWVGSKRNPGSCTGPLPSPVRLTKVGKAKGACTTEW